MKETSISALLDATQARVRPLAQAGDWPGVERIARELTQAAPSAPEAWLMRSHACAKLGRYKDACDCAEAAYRLQAPTPEESVYVARLAVFAQDLPRADAALTRAEKSAADHPAVLGARALYLTHLGRLEEAEAFCRKSIEADPSRVDAWPHLSTLRDGRLTDEEEETLRTVINDEGSSPQLKTAGGFVLAHALDARGAADAAFAEYARANARAAAENDAAGFVFNRAAYEAWTRRLIALFQGARDVKPVRDDAATPVFIVGAPRSGSTLVESVFAAHSRVAPGGEAEMLPPLFTGWMRATRAAPRATLTEEERRRFSERYRQGVNAGPGEDYFSDKNLLNIEAVGFIAEIFPRAKIIHVRRAPMEAGLGVYRQKFKPFWPWTTRLEDIGARLGQLARLAAHWERRYPERFLTVQYETLTDDFETGVARLLDFCGLDFEDACLDFHNAARPVATMSAAQVREPVRKRAGKAAAYDAHLAPLRRALEAAAVDLETGALKR